MKIMIKFFITTIFCVISLNSNAWVIHNDVSITRIMQFEGDIGRDYSIIYFSNNSGQCRVHHTDKVLFSFILSIHMASKKVNVICHDLQDDPGGSTIPTHKLHRVITN